MRKIVVCLDGSVFAEAILPEVRDLGRRTGAEVVLLHVVHLPAGVSTEGQIGIYEIIAHEESAASKYLRAIANALSAEGVTVRTMLAIGATALEIVRFAEREHADMLALATHAKSGVQRWLHGGVADAISRATRCPLLLAHGRKNQSCPGGIRRVVASLDGSALAEMGLPVARDLARTLRVPLLLLGAGAEGHAAYLAEIAEKERTDGLIVETATAMGGPARVMLRHGEAHPEDLLVLATQARPGWRTALMGPIARRVVVQSRRPIVVVPCDPQVAGSAIRAA
ncbi:MAG: universal stress protein [Candidatus Binatia bacterium]